MEANGAEMQQLTQQNDAAAMETIVVQQSDDSETNSASQFCLDCLKKSSVRGLPRILSSQSSHLKLLWSAAVIAFLAGLTYNLAMLTVAYRRGDVVITERPQRPRPEFPSITVCDASPVPLSTIDRLSIPPTQYRKQVLRSAKLLFSSEAANSINDKENIDEAMLLRELLNPKTYFDFLHKELINLTLVGFNDSLVLSCHAHVEIGGKNFVRRCFRVRKTLVPGYQSCSTIEPGLEGEKVTKVSFHVLLDSEENLLECRHCIPEHDETMRTGTIVFVHEKDFYPVSVDAGMFVTPGIQDFVLLKSRRMVLASDCSESHPDKLDFTFYGERMSSTYNQQLCQSLVRQDLIRKICDCTATSFPNTIENVFETAGNASHGESATLPSCAEKVLSNATDSFDGIKCIMNVDKLLQLGDSGVILPSGDTAANSQVLANLDRRCPKPCRFLEFTTARSATRGVTKNTALEIYRTLVANTSTHSRIKHHLEPYTNALLLKSQNRLEEARQLMAKTDYLEQNFLTVVVWFPDKMSTRAVHQYIIGLASYLSQVGGLLSLFSGITVICIAELLELFINLACNYSKRLGKRRTNNGK